MIDNDWNLQHARRHSTDSCVPLQAGHAVAGTETRTTYVVHNQAGRDRGHISGEVLRTGCSLPVQSCHIDRLVDCYAESGQTHSVSRLQPLPSLDCLSQ